MNSLHLHQTHQASGALFVEEGGWNVPASYGDVDGEYQAVREAAGVLDRSHRGVLVAGGEDRKEFLGGMLSNRVAGMEEGEGNHTTMSDPQGHTLADAWLSDRGDVIVLETEPGLQSKLHDSLDRFLITEDVTLEDATGRWAIIGVHGPSASSILSGVLSVAPPEDLPEGHCFRGQAATLEVTVVARNYTGETGWDLWCSPESVVDVWEAIRGAGARPIGSLAADTLRVEAGVPRYGVDFGEEVMVLEAGLEITVDFGKGCFIGQEAIGKMRHLGKPRRTLVGIQVDDGEPPAPGSSLVNGEKEAGIVKTSVRSPILKQTIALASVRRGYEEVGTTLLLPDGRQAKVCALPFLK
jgi:folate-binding protein YgfZ